MWAGTAVFGHMPCYGMVDAFADVTCKGTEVFGRGQGAGHRRRRAAAADIPALGEGWRGSCPLQVGTMTLPVRGIE